MVEYNLSIFIIYMIIDFFWGCRGSDHMIFEFTYIYIQFLWILFTVIGVLYTTCCDKVC